MIKPPNATQEAASSSPTTTPAWHFQLQITSLVKSSLNDKGLIWHTQIRAAALPAPCCSRPLPIWGGFPSHGQLARLCLEAYELCLFLLYRLFIGKEILSLKSLPSIPGKLSPIPGRRRDACSGWYWVAGQETGLPRGVLRSLPTLEPGSACEAVEEKSEGKCWNLPRYSVDHWWRPQKSCCRFTQTAAHCSFGVSGLCKASLVLWKDWK